MEAMNKTVSVSVVMAVYNGAAKLRETLNSVLRQDGVDLELIVVNDGSTDGTLGILRQYEEADRRLKVLEQENRGLVRSLIRGCENAKGKYIARQDAGDVSLPGRLARQTALLDGAEEVTLASCGTRFVGPFGEHLYNIVQSDAEADEGLRRLDAAGIRGPSHHGSTMFRRKDYAAVGGYREHFEVAQDLDLWLRFSEHGKHRSIQGILYEARFLPGGISSAKRRQQIETTKLILEAAQRRRSGQDEEAVLTRAARLKASAKRRSLRLQDASYYYFVASCIRNRDPGLSRKYFMRAIRRNPFHLKAIIRLLQTAVRN